MNAHSYRVDIRWISDRQGMMTSPELKTEIEVATPPPFPKGVEGIWSPEHLFTSAVASCLMTTFLAVAEHSKLEIVSFSVSSNGILEQIDGKYLMTRVELFPQLIIKHEKDLARAERILQKSEAACLISNSIKSQIVLQPEIKFLEKADT